MDILVVIVLVVAAAMLVRKYLYSRPIKFRFGGERYVRHPDGRISQFDGAPIADPATAAAVAAYWKKMEVDAAEYDNNSGD